MLACEYPAPPPPSPPRRFVQTGHGAAQDKPAGVVALTCFDLRRQGLVGRMVLCDRSGSRMPAVRENLQRKVGGRTAPRHAAHACQPCGRLPHRARLSSHMSACQVKGVHPPARQGGVRSRCWQCSQPHPTTGLRSPERATDRAPARCLSGVADWGRLRRPGPEHRLLPRGRRGRRSRGLSEGVWGGAAPGSCRAACCMGGGRPPRPGRAPGVQPPPPPPPRCAHPPCPPARPPAALPARRPLPAWPRATWPSSSRQMTHTSPSPQPASGWVPGWLWVPGGGAGLPAQAQRRSSGCSQPAGPATTPCIGEGRVQAFCCRPVVDGCQRLAARQ